LRMTAGRNWMRVADDRARWRAEHALNLRQIYRRYIVVATAKPVICSFMSILFSIFMTKKKHKIHYT
jgi:hypothetical protein